MASRFSASVGRVEAATSGLRKRSNSSLLLLFFLPAPPVSWRSNRLSARPGTWLFEDEDGAAMASRVRRAKGDVSTTTVVDRNSATSEEKEKENKLQKRGSRSCCGSALRGTSRERRRARCERSLSGALGVRACVRCVRCPARFSGARESERGKKEQICRFRSFAFSLRFLLLT